MIIVSQDKRTIINFDNLKTIELDRETNFTSINIFRETNEVETGVCGLFIGHYATEERAKEVLQEIIKAYIESKKGEEATTIFGFAIIPSNTYYEMPQE